MPSLLSFHDQQHITRMFVQEQRVNMIFNQFVSAIAPEMRRWKDAGNKNSVWVRNPGIEKTIDRYLIQLQSSLEKEIKSGQTKAWDEAVTKNDKMVEGYIKGMSLSSIVKEGMFKRNLDALEMLQNRTENGLNLSQRVWNITGQTKGHVELFLESGIASGRGADQISRDFRQMLENPEKRFRRVRNAEGKLVFSQPMKDYHPGRGVYRSSKMNAIRVSATETNMGYRMSDCERWKQLDFVLGFEVKRSRNSHPCAVCDALVGRYPKDFIFPGWHPFCICIAVPIVLQGEDFTDYLFEKYVPGQPVKEMSLPKGSIKDIPVNARKWIDNYTQKTGSVPYFVKKNESILSKPAKKLRYKTAEEKADIQKRWDERKLYNTVKKTENEIRMSKNFETAVAFDKSGKIVLDKRGQATTVQFTDDECISAKDAIFTHNHPRGWDKKEGTIGRIGNSFSKEDISFAIGNDVAEIRAVTPTYTFVMKRPEGGWGIDLQEMRKSVSAIEDEVKSKMTKLIRKADYSQTSMDRANVLHFHLIWKEFAKKHGIEYRKTMSIVKK